MKKKAQWALGLSLAMLFCSSHFTLSVFAQQHGRKSKSSKATVSTSGPFKVTPLLGKKRAEYEKTLGKPIGGEEGEYKYRVKGFKEVTVTGGVKGQPMANIAFVFVQSPADWQAALKAVGIDAAGAELGDPGKMEGQAEYIKNIKGTPQGWQAVWTSSKKELLLMSPDGP